MPEFERRLDDAYWQLPTMQDIFMDQELPLRDELQISAIGNQLIQGLANAGIDSLYQQTQAVPAYTVFELSILSHHQFVDIVPVLQQIATANGWILGHRQNPASPKTGDVFVKDSNNQPLALRYLLNHKTYRHAEAGTFIPLGINLQQKAIIRDLATTRHIIVAGDAGTKGTILRSLLLPLLLTNTPMSLRLAMLGRDLDLFTYFSKMPHALSIQANRPQQGIRILSGMIHELKKRQSLLAQAKQHDLNAYNFVCQELNLPNLPRIIIVLDSDDAHFKSEPTIIEKLKILMSVSQDIGIHCLIGTQTLHHGDRLAPLFGCAETKIIGRDAATLGEIVPDYHPSLAKFIDAFLVDSDTIKALEVAITPSSEIKLTADYWQKQVQERVRLINLADMNTKKRITTIFEQLATLPNPPIPDKPDPNILHKVAEKLSKYEELSQAVEETTDVEITSIIESPPPVKVSQEESNIDIELVQRAQALSAYLGWLGRGALVDVMGVTIEEADKIIAILQARQILERGSGPTVRTKIRR